MKTVHLATIDFLKICALFPFYLFLDLLRTIKECELSKIQKDDYVVECTFVEFFELIL